MSTRARIGILNPNGSVDSIYHHWDGYPEWLGKKLVQNHNSLVDASNLMTMGDTSCIETKTDWDRNELDEPIILTYAMRGEVSASRHTVSLMQFFRQCVDCCAEYAYLWENDSWVAYRVHSQRLYKINMPTFDPVTP